MPRGLVTEQWDLALLPHGCHHSSEGSKGVFAPCEAFPALHLSYLMEVSSAKQGGPSEPLAGGEGALELGGNACCDLSWSWGGFLLMPGLSCIG